MCYQEGAEMVMTNITLSVDRDVIKKVRKIAVDKDMTLTAMIREFLVSVAEQDAQARELSIGKLNSSFGRYSRDMGPREWTRDELHDRR